MKYRVHMSELMILCACFLLCVSAETPIILHDNTNYFKDEWDAYLSPWGKGTITDFSETMTIYPSTFPNNTLISFSWPPMPDNAVHITAYLAIDYGDYYGTRDPRPITPAQINSISQLLLTHDVTFNNSVVPNGGNDVIYDLFLTSTPNGDNNHLFEIEVFVYTPTFALWYMNSLAQIGKVNVSGVEWTVTFSKASNPHDILIYPTNLAPIPKATIDLNAMFTYLKQKSILTGQEYYNGHAFGVETVRGEGTLRVNTLSVQYAHGKYL
eukprot:TRINITY_DN22287_c0_g1_i1.p1 TRINITY_DN22287_c0_g1~~TRINITY_DN22287_c0_g1_i1.p1  ORF type:complete len:275 (+),score=50.71 TRINITY_DN22287_c0_g1_i1:23-826(+)